MQSNNDDIEYQTNLNLQNKINFYNRQIQRMQKYCKTLQKSLILSKRTSDRLYQKTSTSQIIQSLRNQNKYYYHSILSLQQDLKELNSKLLIQVQLRNEQITNNQYRCRQFEQQLDSLRLKMKDKQKQYLIVVSRLKKYEDIKEFIIEQKLANQMSSLKITKEDTQIYIGQLLKQLGKYKDIVKKKYPDIDRKIKVLCESIDQSKYDRFVRDINFTANSSNQIISPQQKNNQIHSKKTLSFLQSPSKAIRANLKNLKINHKSQINRKQLQDPSNKELIKQLKRALFSNKLLQSSLNQSIQRNQQLLVYNEILSKKIISLTQKLDNIQDKLTKYPISQNKENLSEKISKNRRFKDQQYNNYIQIPTYQYLSQKRYLEALRSPNYQVNIQQLQKDINKISQFLILLKNSAHKNPGKTIKKSLSMDKFKFCNTVRLNSPIKITNNKLSQNYSNKDIDPEFEIIQY